MNKQRAIEISESAIMKHVTYQDTPVYIQHVNEDEAAGVYPIGNSGQEMTVPLSSLTEHP